MGLFEWLSPGKAPKSPNTYKFSNRAKIITLWIMAVSCVAFLFVSVHLLKIFIWAAIAAYLFNPVITFFSGKTKASRAASIVVLYVIIGILLSWSVKSVLPFISNEIADLTSGSITDTTSFIGKVANAGSITIIGMTIDLKEIVIATSSWIKEQFSTQGIPIFIGALERFIFLIVFFVLTFFFLLDAGKFREAVEKLIPNPYREELSYLIERINMTLGAYIRAQIVLILVMSIASFTVLSVLRIHYAGVLSIMTGVLEVFPVIGPVCATAIVATVALFQVATPFGLSNAVLAMMIIIAYFLLRQLEDYFVIPLVASRFVKVHPVIGIFALIIGGNVGGVLGLFLAIPSAAIIKVLFSYFYYKLVE